MPKALVVEDDLRILALVRQSLQTEGFTVLEAQDSKEAWRILQEERPEAAVVDLYLRTERDGWNFLETVRGDGRFARFPMVVMTGSVGPEASSDPGHRFGRSLHPGSQGEVQAVFPLQEE